MTRTAVATVTELVLAAAEDGPVRLACADEDASRTPSVRAAGDEGVEDRVSIGPEPLQEAARDDVRGRHGAPSSTRSCPTRVAAAAVVVVTLGTRTGLELATLATACADAGRDLIGTVVALPRHVGSRREVPTAHH